MKPHVDHAGERARSRARQKRGGERQQGIHAV